MKILGFHIVEKQGKRGKPKWQGWRSIGGKQKWVYIGDDIELAEAKIKAYCQKYEYEYLLDDTREQVPSKNTRGLDERVTLLELENKDLRREVDELRQKVEGQNEQATPAHQPEPGKANREKNIVSDMAKIKALCIGKSPAIAKKAGVNKSTVSRYFQGTDGKNQDAIYSAILETLYPAFVTKCNEVSQSIMGRDRTASSSIWEIRQALGEYPQAVFDDLLRRMEAKRLVYFNKHSDIGSLTDEQRAGSIMDEKKGLLFYMVWR